MHNLTNDNIIIKSPVINMSNQLRNSNCFHIKNKPSLPNQTTVSMINKSNLRTMNKTTPIKQLNKKIIDTLNISSNMNDSKYNKTYQPSINTNANKNQYKTEETGVLNQELQSSNNIIFSLRNIIMSLTQKIEQMEQDNINLTEYYKKKISELQTENEDIKNQINEIAEASNSYILAELESVTEEENRLQQILKQKEEENRAIEEEVNAIINEIEQQKEELPSINSYYKSIIRKKEQQLDYLDKLNKGSFLIYNSKKYLLPKSKMNILTNLLRIQLSLLPEKIKKDDFILYLLDNTNIASELTCSDIATRLLTKINSCNDNINNNINAYDQETIQGYLETLLLEEDKSYCDINYMNDKLSILLNDIEYYTEDDHKKYFKDFIFFFKPKVNTLEELLQSNGVSNRGIINYDKFNNVLKALQIKLSNEQLKYGLYIMKSYSNIQLSMFELNYNNLLSFLNPKPAKKVDNYISRIKGYLNKEHTSIRDFIFKLNAKIQVISEQKYIENEDMNEYLKERGILNANEELDQDNTPELINVDFLVNLFEQESIDNNNINQSKKQMNNEKQKNKNTAYNAEILNDLALKLTNEILTDALSEYKVNMKK